MPEHEAAGGLIELKKRPADRMLLLGIIPADRDRIHKPRKPARLEMDVVHAGKQNAHGRVEGHGQHRGDSHGQILGVGQGFEEPALLVHQGKYRHEGGRDHEQGEEHGRADLLKGLETHLVEVALAACLVPPLELLVGVLHLHDGPIHQYADGDGDARNGHDVGGHPHQVHGDENEDHRHRNRDDGDDGGRNVPEENQDHEAHDNELKDQFLLERMDGAFNQLGTVVGGDDFDPFGERGFDLLKLLFHPLDDVEGVFTVAHHHDAAHGVALAVNLGYPAADVGAHGYLAESPDQDGRALDVAAHHDVLDVGARLGVAPAAHHVLLAGELDQAAAHVVVAVPDGVEHLHERDVVGDQSVGI